MLGAAKRLSSRVGLGMAWAAAARKRTAASTVQDVNTMAPISAGGDEQRLSGRMAVSPQQASASFDVVSACGGRPNSASSDAVVGFPWTRSARRPREEGASASALGAKQWRSLLSIATARSSAGLRTGCDPSDRRPARVVLQGLALPRSNIWRPWHVREEQGWRRWQ